MELKGIKFRLPTNVVTRQDISRLVVEVDELDEFFIQMKLGKISKDNLPLTSRALNELIQLNGVNLLNQAHRSKLKLLLQTIRTKAPSVHISFSGEPSRIFLDKLITWMRANIHPLLILEIGLQPNIGVGFTLRTDNKIFDFSLKQRISSRILKC